MARAKRNSWLVEKISEYYITYRKRYLVQTETGYMTTNWPLSDSALYEHVNKKTTLGIFSGEVISKFITFDVDGKKDADTMTLELVNTLGYEFGIDFRSILVTYSGNKGYHVTVFFDDVLDVNILKRFYFLVLQKLEYSSKEIEFRATNKLGVKLPFSVHRRTGKACHIVDTRTLERRPNVYFKGIRRENKDKFLEWYQSEYEYEDILAAMEDVKYFDTLGKVKNGPAEILTQEELKKYKKVEKELKVEDGITNDSKIETVQEVLANNKLLYPDSRNQMTYYISMYLKDIGYDLETTKSIITSVMLNTMLESPELIDSKKTKVLREIEKVANQTYKKGYTLANAVGRTVKIYEDEILDVLELKNFTLMKLYLSHLVHAKKYGKEGKYYMAYSVMTRMGNAKYIGSLKKYMEKLEELGRIRVGEREVSKSQVRVYETKRYEQIKKFDQVGVGYEVGTDVEDIDLPGILVNMVDKKLLKNKLGRRVYERYIA